MDARRLRSASAFCFAASSALRFASASAFCFAASSALRFASASAFCFAASSALTALVSLPGIRYMKPRLAQRTVFRRSFSEGLAVFEQEPRGKGTAEWNALAAVLYPDVLA